jgi:hypothetical protein
MSNVIRFRVPDANAEVFGGCPSCGCVDNIWNIGRDHWAVCHLHKTKWYIGSNLFSNWRRESEEDWLSNEYRLRHYRSVESVFRHGGAA